MSRKEKLMLRKSALRELGALNWLQVIQHMELFQRTDATKLLLWVEHFPGTLWLFLALYFISKDFFLVVAAYGTSCPYLFHFARLSAVIHNQALGAISSAILWMISPWKLKTLRFLHVSYLKTLQDFKALLYCSDFSASLSITPRYVRLKRLNKRHRPFLRGHELYIRIVVASRISKAQFSKNRLEVIWFVLTICHDSWSAHFSRWDSLFFLEILLWGHVCAVF